MLKLAPGADFRALSRQAGAESIQLLSAPARLYALRLPPKLSPQAAAERLGHAPGVIYAESNHDYQLDVPGAPRLASIPIQAQPADSPQLLPQAPFRLAQTSYEPDDQQYPKQWNMRLAHIDQAWSLIRGNPAITVAVIDSGVDPNHPDLLDALLPLEDVYRESKGRDLFTHTVTGDPIDYDGRDGNGHGTHVAGILAATMNNRVGVAGVAGGGVKILPIKATNYAGATDAATLTLAFQRAIDKGARVINISIAGPATKSTRALTEVIELAVEKNITIVAAAGNESLRESGLIAPLGVPAAYPEVIAVGAGTAFDKVANYSNAGPELDLIAPGGGSQALSLTEGPEIWSTWPSYPTYASYQSRLLPTYYGFDHGTSMASPHVAGVVALMLAREPGLTPAQIRSRLIATADDIGPPGFDPDSGYGMLNAYRALSWAADDAGR